jgi:hypothetical protein
MNGVIYKNQDYQKQERKYSLSVDKHMRKLNGNDHDTTIRRVNEHSYIVSFDKLQQETIFHSGKSTLTDIYTEILHNKENLFISQGFIHIKEYVVDSYECRCHENNDLLNDEEIDNNKLKF